MGAAEERDLDMRGGREREQGHSWGGADRRTSSISSDNACELPVLLFPLRRSRQPRGAGHAAVLAGHSWEVRMALRSEAQLTGDH